MGVETTIHGLDTYVSNSSSMAIIVVIPDIFGWEFTNTRLVAGEVSNQTGVTVYLLDFMDGDSFSQKYGNTPSREAGIPESSMYRLRAIFALESWLIRHREAKSWKTVHKFFEDLYLENANRSIFVAGYSWGARHAILLTDHDRCRLGDGTFPAGGLVQAAFTAHPMLLSIPKEIKAIDKPISLAPGNRDKQLSVKRVAKVLEALAKNAIPESEVIVYEGGFYGFTMRAKMTVPEQRKDKQAALVQSRYLSQ